VSGRGSSDGHDEAGVVFLGVPIPNGTDEAVTPQGREQADRLGA
jgi:hypothetical protein